MQHGASLSASQLIKLLTRGKTSRLSADALLDFFRPLKAWLEQQNRNEIIGWNSNSDDVALFKPVTSGGTAVTTNLKVFTYFWFLIVVNCFLFCQI